jgi:hypothetical protein
MKDLVIALLALSWWLWALSVAGGSFYLCYHNGGWLNLGLGVLFTPITILWQPVKYGLDTGHWWFCLWTYIGLFLSKR